MFKNKIVRNASFVSSGAIVGKLLALVTLYFTSRLLGPGNFGAYNFAVVYAGYFGILADFGTTQVMIIKGAQQPKNRSKLFWQIAYFRSIVGLVIAGLLICSAVIVTSDVNARRAIIISSLAIPIGNMSGLLGAFFISGQMHNFKVIIETIITLLVAGFSILFLYLGFGYVTLLTIALSSSLIAVYLMYQYLRRHGMEVYSRPDKKSILAILKMSAPFGVIFFLANVFNRIDIFIIQNVFGSTAVGFYSAAYKLMNNVAFIPGAIASALFPVMSILAIEDEQKLARVMQRALSIVITLGLFIAGIVMVWGKQIVELYFGGAYQASVNPTLALGWAVPLMFANSIIIFLFYARQWTKQVLVIMSSLVIINVLTNLILVKRVGILGAAWATVICEGVELVLFLIILSRVMPQILSNWWGNIKTPLITTSIAVGVWYTFGISQEPKWFVLSTLILLIGLVISIYQNRIFSLLFIKSPEKEK